MSILVIIFGVFAAVALLVALFGLTQPRVVKLVVTHSISASSETLYPYISNLENFVKWSPWSKKDPQMKQRFEGIAGTVGSAYYWSGNRKVGKGSMTFLSQQEPHFTQIALNFGPRGGAEVSFELTPQGNKMKVDWTFENDLGANPLSRAFGPLMKKMIVTDFQNGLNQLETLCVQS
jgi:hypothetical protein